jgi:periplasmic protein TonB
VSQAQAAPRATLALPLTLSTLGHLAVAALLIFVHPAPPPPQPPMYRVNILAAPPGPRAEGVVTPPAPTPAPAAEPVPPRAQTAPRAMPMPEKAPVKSVPRATSTPVPVTTPRKAPPTPAGGGPTGGRGTDVATVRTEGIDFPFPGYLENIVRQIAKNFGDHRNTFVRAEVQFLIRRDGSVTGFSFLSRSGNYSFDLDAQGAVEQAGNSRSFGPLPNGFPDDVLPVNFSFDPTVVH